MSSVLLTTKLHMPSLRPDLVPRPRLLDCLNAGLGRKLTLVSAPPGFGKTTVVAEWIRHCGARAAWISLDEGDDDIARFLTCIVAAVETLQPGVGQTALALLHSSQPPQPRAIVAALVNDLDALDRPCALVLDDYHVITARPIHDALAFLLDHLPPPLHIGVLTRADPPLPLSRLRAGNQLVEIRAADLRFTAAEAAAFLNGAMGLGLDADDVAALEARTEGWIAALHLAALSMQGRHDLHDFVSAFAGSHRYIVDYLVEEVLDRQPDVVQSFLLQTSLVDRLSGPLCEALTERPGGQAALEDLERANLFVTALDDVRGWYRYHHLFVDVLRNRLRQAYPDRLPGLHRRAADWHEQHGFVAEAIGHALAGGDQGRAARLVERNAMALLMRGETATLLRWIEPVKALAPERPWLGIFRAWALTLTGQLESVPQLLEAVETGALADGGQNGHLLGHLAAIRAYLAAMQGDASGAIELARRALEYLPESDLALRSVVALTLGGACWLRGDVAGAAGAFAEAARLGKAAGNVHVAVPALSTLAGLLIEQGQLHRAAEALREAERLATTADGRPLPVAARAHSGLATLSYQWNDLEAASQHASRAVELGRQWGRVEAVVGGRVMLALVAHARGQLDAARAALREADRLVDEQGPLLDIAPHVEACRVRLWLGEGQLSAALEWARRRDLKTDADVPFPRKVEYLALGRVLLAQGELETVLPWIGRLLDAARIAGRIGTVVELLVLRALALQARGDLPEALVALAEALSIAEPEGYLRVFLDEGTPMTALLRHAGSRGISPRYVVKLLSLFPTTSDAAPAAQPLAEPVTERELDVLRLLADGLSNQAIAEKLVVTVGTVKAHTASIYRKLDVNSRTQAIARARVLGLL